MTHTKIIKLPKKNFKYVQCKAIYEYENETYNQLNKSAEHDVRLFWRLSKQTKKKSSSVCSKLVYNSTTARSRQGIADLFSTYFHSLYDENNIEHFPSYENETQNTLKLT